MQQEIYQYDREQFLTATRSDRWDEAHSRFDDLEDEFLEDEKD